MLTETIQSGKSIIELSIIIPVINEAQNILPLFVMLEKQENINFEIVFCDGGSKDGTPNMIVSVSRKYSFPVRSVVSGKGRAIQMNRGMEESMGGTLLFLHADSFFEDRYALRKGIDTLATKILSRGNERIAGRFALRFTPGSYSSPSPGIYFFENKARLNREDCIHGDQGFLLRKKFFKEIGKYDDSLPMLEDDRLAKKILDNFEWTLIDCEIFTSARRFEVEGLFQRQLLNAILKNSLAIGWNIFFRQIPKLYQSQNHSQQLKLLPFLNKISELLAPLPLQEQFRLWRATGDYVLSHAWQIPYAVDVRRNYNRAIPVGKESTPSLLFFDRSISPFLKNRFMRLVSTLLVWAWFHLTRLYYRIT